VTKRRPKKPDEPWLKLVGDNLRAARKAAALTQEQLAELADLAPRTIQKIEAGNITILVTTLRRIRKVLGCSYDGLLGDKWLPWTKAFRGQERSLGIQQIAQAFQLANSHQKICLGFSNGYVSDLILLRLASSYLLF
jgi:transcriptional regulator with XRE-family HTH domain